MFKGSKDVYKCMGKQNFPLFSIMGEGNRKIQIDFVRNRPSKVAVR